MLENRLAVVSVIVENRAKSAEINGLLTEFGDFIIGRMGIPHRERGVSLISIAMDAPADVISALSGKLGRICGVSAKVAYSKLPES